MTDDQNYSKREQDHFFSELFKRMDTQDKTLERIEEQTKKTNGRVTKLETETKDYPEAKKDINALQNWRWYILGAGAVLLLLGGFVYELILSNIKTTMDLKYRDAQQSLMTAIDQKMSALNNPASLNNSVNVR